MYELQGAVVIVTGAAGGLGAAMSKGLADAGACLVACDLPGRFGTDTDPRWHRVEADIGSSEGAQALVDAALAFGPLHALVNNAGVGMQFINPRFASEPTPFWQLAPDDWISAFRANTHSQFLLARLAAPAMLRAGRGRIVNVSTSYATMQLPGFSPYGPSKAAVEAATVIWARDLAGSGVTVNALLPGGAADTRMITDGAVFADRAKLVPPQAMVAPLLYLLTPRAASVTGQRVVAKHWDAALAEDTNIATAVSPAGWGDQPHARPEPGAPT